MNRKTISIIAAGIAAVFTATIILLISGISGDFRRGPDAARGIFNGLSDRTADILTTVPAGSEQFFDDVRTSFVLTDDIASITIESEGQVIYQYPSDTARVSSSSPFIHAYSSRIGTPDNNVTLTAQIYVLKPASIFQRARIAFLFTLAGTLTAAVLLVYLYLTEKQEPDTSAKTADYHEPSEPAQPVPAAEEIPVQEQPADLEHAAEREKPAEETAAVQLEPAEEPQPVQQTADRGSSPEGLFSPVTGFGWESYLLPRLESELVRAASSEQDLSLFIIRIPGFDRTCGTSKEVCKYLIDQFVFPDMLFEYKEDGFAAVKLNESLDTALNLAEDIHADITAVLRKNHSTLGVSIGISARSLRIISCDRLLTEASQAADHALSDNDSPVVAFRVNPDKYRKFLADNAGSAK